MKTLFDITIDFEKSKGSFLYDKQRNQKFLDLFSLYSSLPLGYNHPIFDQSFRDKVNRVSHLRMTNNMFKSDELNEFLQEFEKQVFSKFIHLTCTGALAVESALKCTMEYKKVKEPMVLGLKKSFHGVNSWGFLTDRFGPTALRLENFPQNNWKNLSVSELRNYFSNENLKNLVAVIIEPIQSTAGDHYIPVDEIKEIHQLCQKNDVAFVLDEIQTGFGVTGSMWYYQKLGITPDILVFGKKSQICGIVTNEKYSACLTSSVQKLDVTFDGDLIDAIRACYVMKAYRQDDLLAKAEENSKKFREIISPAVENYRSCGHLIAYDFSTREKRDAFVKACFQRSVLVNGTAEKSVRMRPNLAITSYEINFFEKVFKEVCLELKSL